MGAKVVLSRLPISYERWRKLGAFRHGAMIDGSYAKSVFTRHYARVAASLAPRFAVLELGPGDSLSTAVIASAFGAGRTYLVDAGRFAIADDVRPYNLLAARLQSEGRPAPGAPYSSIEQMLHATHATYVTDGLDSLESLPSSEIDFAFSQAVLEHIALGEFDETIRQLFRVQRETALCSHRIDLQDHLAHSLNSLRFSTRVWESRLLSTSGFYTNRLRASQIRARFEQAGYRLESWDTERWPRMPVPADRLSSEFRDLPEADLLVRSIDVVARRPAA
jgi:hypothetical protein